MVKPHAKFYRVGVFDSGIGGLSILAQIREQAPDIELHYFADDAFAPYGNLEINQLKQRVIAIAEFFIYKKNVDAIVIACNTATVSTIQWLRASPLLQQYPVCIIGVEPAVKPASAITNKSKITVLATPITRQSARLNSLILQEVEKANRVGKTLEFDCIESQTLAFDIDSLPETNNSVNAEVLNVVRAVQQFNSDTLVLACTHYPLIKSMFEQYLDKNVSIIEPSYGVTKFLLNQLKHQACGTKSNTLFVYSSSGQEYASRLLYWIDKLKKNNQIYNVVLMPNIRL